VPDHPHHPRLSASALNRATLDRQLLLRRHPLPARQAVGHLAGLQGQAPLAPYLGLWTRLAAFTPEELSDLLSERSVVRAPIMRATVHLVDAADFGAFRPLFGPLMAAGLRPRRLLTDHIGRQAPSDRTASTRVSVSARYSTSPSSHSAPSGHRTAAASSADIPTSLAN
jgi:hypothetical protein